ncbi:uncharacterized protein LOC109596287 [Aethina tumida]|uniref:uncharacterized protein LOC109596287 n=1 Tax=Aethina tumida TaxID=116153 RepID=UPI002147833A|nr:uncharacterized protein LOC109596287 [Aethina tumida]
MAEEYSSQDVTLSGNRKSNHNMEIPLQERNYRTENHRNDNLTDDILYNNTNNVDNIPKRKRYNFIPVFDENATSEERISTLYQCIDGVRKAYVDAKAKLAKLDKKSRKFKRLQKKAKAKNMPDKQINTNLESNLNSVTEISSEDECITISDDDDVVFVN